MLARNLYKMRTYNKHISVRWYITDIPIMKYALGGLYNLEQSSIH